jgi:predicted DNA-binding transcriptional regulator AlpA
MEKQAIRRPAVARRYGVSVKTTYRMQERGVLPPPDLRVGQSDAWWTSTLERVDATLAPTGEGRAA